MFHGLCSLTSIPTSLLLIYRRVSERHAHCRDIYLLIVIVNLATNIRTQALRGVRKCNKMQSETADFAPSAAADWRNGRSICVVFDSGPFASLCEKVMSSTEPELHSVLQCCQRWTVKCEIWACGIEIRQIAR